MASVQQLCALTSARPDFTRPECSWVKNDPFLTLPPVGEKVALTPLAKGAE